MKIDKTNFKEWNEGMSRKHNPDMHHNHPNPIMKFLERRRTNSIMKFLDVRDADSVLDIGCGAGNMLDEIMKGSLFGIDMSTFVLGLSKKRLGDRVNLFRGNAEMLPFKDSTFDRIFCSEVIEHTMNPQRVIGEIYRILKPDGISVLSFPNEDFTVKLKQFIKSSGIARLILPANKGDESKLYDVHEWHLHAFSLKFLKQIIKGTFEVYAYTGIPFGIVPVKYVVRLVKLS